jgi:uncharacterized protein
VRVEALQLVPGGAPGGTPGGAEVAALTAAFHVPPRRRAPGVLLVPGAGGDLHSAGLTALAEVLASLGHPVVRANLPHNELGRRAPRADRSVEAFRRLHAAAVAATRVSGAWIVGGRSYGGRVASMALSEGSPAAGLLLYSYPLHPPGRPDQLRVEHWPGIAVPSLFLQGDRDPFCELELLEANVRRLPRRATVHVVAGGDHALRVTRAASPTGQASSEAATVTDLTGVLRAWVATLRT